MTTRRFEGLPSRGIIEMRAAYVAILFLATLLPFAPDFSSPAVLHRLGRAFHPGFHTYDAVDAVRNVILFAGWGAVWVATTVRGSRVRQIARATGTAALLSTLVETCQLFSRVRTASILDVATNTVGGAVGAAAVLLAIAAAAALRSRRSFIGMPAPLFGFAYLGAAAMEAFLPLLRQGRVPGADGPPAQRLALVLEYARRRPDLAIRPGDLLLFLPVGLFLVPAFVELGAGYRAAALIATGAGVLVFGLAELGHGTLGMGFAIGSLLAHVLAATLGAWLTARALPGLTTRWRGRARPAAVLVLYALILAIWYWRPFSPESLAGMADKLGTANFIPLTAYRERMDLGTAADVLASAFLFFPLGALLTVWPLRRHGPLRQLLPGIYLAMVLEGAQVLVAGRTFDITDLLIAWGALTLGWVVLERAGFQPHGQILAASARRVS